ncbi:polysaccharide deacetylase family protein [Spectribacter hydrogenoxidans]|uniref:Polysaccharide deacetylase family protein n=1 Tax=Spectribacter hydrogenoxidans TaxID=3075608 RepID=A0ABU3C4U0_9GAMM|nr:polysaccharide deacetylase family protein [Salinisphaera sp. W335]MDT0636364.1 polysaccharide deacetylase family protein [Salinisphaera sp. W335]
MNQIGVDFPFDTPIPAPGAPAVSGELVSVDRDGAVLHFDLLTMTWWILSRAEEVSRDEVDKHGRFPAKASHAWQHGYLDRPIVDEWLQVFRAAAQRVWPDLALCSHPYRVAQGHDVDRPSRYAFVGLGAACRRVAGDLIHRRWESALAAPLSWASRAHLHSCDPYNTFDLLMDRADAGGWKARFFFLAGVTSPQFDGDYSLEDSAIVALVSSIRERGHDVGIHPSYGTFDSVEKLAAEVDRFRHTFDVDEIHSRMHYLRWRHPDTLRNLSAAGVTHDYTLGYAEAPGFRCGTCFEYEAYDPVDDTSVPIQLTPLVAMDVSLLSDQYYEGAAERRIQMLRQLVDACRRVNGCFSFLWHNSELDSGTKRRLLLELADYSRP